MQITDLAKEEKILPLFRLGFRPFFLAGPLFSLIALILWALLYRGKLDLAVYGGGYFWHVHEMIYGFGCAIIVGFLLTAVQNWTGRRGVSGITLGMLFVVWLLGRVTMAVPEFTGYLVASIIDMMFLPFAAYLLALPIIAIKQYRNLIFVPILIGFTLINFMMHLTIINELSLHINHLAYAAVILVTLLMSIMAGRVTPMFTANGTNTTKVDPIPWLERACAIPLIMLLLNFIFAAIFSLNQAFTAFLFILAGIIQMFRWFRWRPWITVSVPLLWSLHLSMAFIWLGLIAIGIAHILPSVPVNHAWHLLTIGGMSGLILAMITRVTLGHTGRMLAPPKPMIIAYFAIFIAALVRSFFPLIMPEKTLAFYDASITFWLVSYTLFGVYYGPMLMTARVDGRPG